MVFFRLNVYLQPLHGFFNTVGDVIFRRDGFNLCVSFGHAQQTMTQAPCYDKSNFPLLGNGRGLCSTFHKIFEYQHLKCLNRRHPENPTGLFLWGSSTRYSFVAERISSEVIKPEAVLIVRSLDRSMVVLTSPIVLPF